MKSWKPLAAAAVLLVFLQAAPVEPVEDQLARLRNLGKAFYENTTTQTEAVETFRQALKLKPDSVRERLNFGLALLRAGKTAEGISVKSPGTTLSTAEAIGTAVDAALHCRFFGDGKVTAAAIARNLIGSIVKEDPQDLAALKEYIAIVAKKRGTADKNWQAFQQEADRTLR